MSEHPDNGAALQAKGTTPEARAATLVRRLRQLGDGATVRRFGTGRVELRAADGAPEGTYGPDALAVLLEAGAVVEVERRAHDVPSVDRTVYALAADAGEPSAPSSAAIPKPAPAPAPIVRRTTRATGGRPPVPLPKPAPDVAPPTPAPMTDPVVQAARPLTLPALGERMRPGALYAGMSLPEAGLAVRRLRAVATAEGKAGNRRFIVDAALVAAVEAEGFAVEHECRTAASRSESAEPAPEPVTVGDVPHEVAGDGRAGALPDDEDIAAIEAAPAVDTPDLDSAARAGRSGVNCFTCDGPMRYVIDEGDWRCAACDGEADDVPPALATVAAVGDRWEDVFDGSPFGLGRDDEAGVLGDWAAATLGTTPAQIARAAAIRSRDDLARLRRTLATLEDLIGLHIGTADELRPYLAQIDDLLDFSTTDLDGADEALGAVLSALR